MSYLEKINPYIKKYYKILSSEFPSFLEDYINTKEMQRISKISMSCGTDYSALFHNEFWYSNLDHSIGVALIIWHFTHNKTQTIAGLFHDISTPVFKHCIDFMNGDGEHQESTEELTLELIKKSPDILNLLERDGIALEDVCDYKIYPIADNESPRLSADRFEYNFSSGMSFYKVWEVDEITKFYNDIVITTNEDGYEELAFQHLNIAEEYIDKVSKLWPVWVCPEDKMVMQFIADICKSIINKGYLQVDDLYKLSEKDVIDIIENCPDNYIKESWKNFCRTKNVFKTKEKLPNKYCHKIKSKIRYLNPIVVECGERIYDVSINSKEQIDNYINQYNKEEYISFDFSFIPYER